MGGEVLLGSLLADVEVGVAGGTQTSAPADGEWGVLRLSAMSSGQFTGAQAKRLTVQTSAPHRYEVRDDDVLMVRVNGAQHLVGSVRSVARSQRGLLLSDLLFRIIPDEDRLLPRFLELLLGSDDVRRQIRAAMRGSSGQFQLPQAAVKALNVPGVPLEDQRRIIAAHAAFERRIEVLESLLGKLLVVEQALSVAALAQTQSSEWDQVSLESVATVAAGVTLGSEPVGDGTVELPYLRVANVLDGRIDTTDVKRVRILRAHYERYALKQGDLLLTEGGDLDKLGRGAVWDGRIKACLHQNHVFRVRCGKALLPDFLALYTASPEGRAYFQRVGKQTTNLASINSTQVKQMPVPLPPVREQERRLGPVRTVRERAQTLERRIAKLRTIQQGVVEDFLARHAWANAA